MKSMCKGRFGKRVIALCMILVLGFHFIPMSVFNVFAATDEYADAITISVTDENNIPISGAVVSYRIDSESEGKNYQIGETTTDDSGTVSILDSSLYQEGDLKLSAAVSMEGYQTDQVTIENVLIESKDQNFQVVLIALESEGIAESETDIAGVPSNKTESNLNLPDAKGDENLEKPVLEGIENQNDLNLTDYEEGSEWMEALSEKADQTLEFDEYHTASSVEYVSGFPPFTDAEFNFKATDKEELALGTITYETEISPEDAGMASISENGILTVTAPGTVVVKATLSGDENYNACTIQHTLTVIAQPAVPGEFISLDTSKAEYLLGTNNGIVSERTASVVGDVDGAITYSIDRTEIGLSCEASSGQVTINDYEKLGSAMHAAGGNILVTVTAEKEAGRKYDKDNASYSIEISFAQASEETYEVLGETGKNGWYITEVDISPSDPSYNISKTFLPSDFSSSVNFEDEGSRDRVVYFQDKTSGAITDEILITGVKIDTVKPDSNLLTIEYLEPVTTNGIYNFYHSMATIRFTAVDVTSGVANFTWSYDRENSISISNVESDGGTLDAVADPDDPTKYTAELTLPKNQLEQMRGNLSVCAEDQAGLVSDLMQDDGRILVIDSISPTQRVSYQLETAGGNHQEIESHHYYSDHVEFVFHITEANFFEEDVFVFVSKNGGDAEQIPVTWNATSVSDEYEAKAVISEEGDYIVSMTYTDRSGNEMTSYESEIITIDKTKPVIAFDYTDSSAEENAQTAKITVTEQNFRSSDLVVITNAQDILGNAIAVDLQDYLRNCSWTDNGNVHTAEISSQFADAIYRLSFAYADLALNPADLLITDSFIVDHTAPEESSMTVTYSTPVMESILSTITFGFYNPSVNVTFSANDMTSGIDYFTLFYQRQSGVSEVNLEKYQDMRLDAVQDEEDKSRFFASVTLPKNQAEQLRGNIAFIATDRCGNVSKKLTDTGHVIVVDTIAPNMTAEYSEESRTVNSKMYYNKAATITFNVTEANFYSQDVIVEISKNGEEAYKITPTWTDRSADLHVGTYTIKAPSNHSGDGDYMIHVSYTDRSNNKMIEFYSRTVVIDTVDPVIKVVYSNKNVIQKLTDTEGKTRKYFDETQMATITIEEHNFRVNDAKFTITAKDVTGAMLSAKNLIRKSSWNNDGDKHVMTITYPGDANYTFDIEYEDLAKNKAANYKEDYFTVDKTKPENLNISYSTSILDTVLETISFGFYNAPMTVTIDAEDTVSGVYSFLYSYVNAADVSSINAELLNQLIEEAEITFTDNRKKATAMFEIPQGALGDGNQFHGNVSFTATDRTGNESEEYQDNHRIVVDNISPTATVEYNTPVQMTEGISYYDGDITATVTVNEANFYPEDVEVSVTQNGASYPVSPSWSDNSADVHTGTFSLTEDGDYLVTISYTDKSSNEMAVYTSEQLTVDTDIIEPEITINGEAANGRAFKDEVSLAVNFEDINFEDYEILLTRTSYGEKDTDVTDRFITGHMKVNGNGGSGLFDAFEKTAENDGIYRLKISIRDRAGHISETEAMFTINRFGSVYEYNDYLVSLIQDGGSYVKEVEDDLIITEYNADRLVDNSLNIEISCDGKPLAVTDYSVSPKINDQVSVGSSGWYQYQYTIDKKNFHSDGVYRISVSSEDATGNMPENTNYEDKSIFFRVDSTAPEIGSITGLERSIINATDVNVKYTVYDTIGLQSVKIYISDKKAVEVTDFSEDQNNYSGSFTLTEHSASQTVRFVVEDLAGNITDTDSKEFTSVYDFNRAVTVSTNLFVRFYANKPLFWGSIGGIAAVLVLAGGFILLWRKKREKEEEPCSGD